MDDLFLLTNSLVELVYCFDLIAFIIVFLIILIVLRMVFIELKSAHQGRSLYERLYIFC